MKKIFRILFGLLVAYTFCFLALPTMLSYDKTKECEIVDKNIFSRDGSKGKVYTDMIFNRRKFYWINNATKISIHV